VNLPSITYHRLLLLACAGAFLTVAVVFDWLATLTIVFLVAVTLGAMTAGLLVLCELFGDSHPPLPGPRESVEPRRQFSLKALFAWMVVAALGWRFLPDLLVKLPELLAGLATVLAVAAVLGMLVSGLLVLFVTGVRTALLVSSALQRVSLNVRSRSIRFGQRSDQA
jgi:hypothetical protein